MQTASYGLGTNKPSINGTLDPAEMTRNPQSIKSLFESKAGSSYKIQYLKKRPMSVTTESLTSPQQKAFSFLWGRKSEETEFTRSPSYPIIVSMVRLWGFGHSNGCIRVSYCGFGLTRSSWLIRRAPFHVLIGLRFLAAVPNLLAPGTGFVEDSFPPD